MHGFGSHTFSFINSQNERCWVKFHFKTQQGIKNWTDAEAEAAIGKCRETHQRDLYDAIERGDFPKWTLFVQVMPELDAEKVPYHPFDLSKVWPHKDYPLIEVGVMGAATATRRIISLMWNRWPSIPPMSRRALASRRIRCCKGVYSATATPSVIG